MKQLYVAFLLFSSFNVRAAAPTIPASNFHLNAVDGGFFNLGWTAGNGARRIIICKAGSDVTFIPQNGIDYTENTNFGDGQQVETGEYVIYDHFSTSFFLTGLAPATQYFFRIYEYNGTGSGIEYLTSSFLAATATTSATPTLQTSNATFSNITTNSFNINWTNGNGGRRLVVVKEGTAVDADPVNSQPYAVNSVFGSGATTGPGNFTVYNSSGTGTSITNLKAGTQYFLAFYEFNGSNQPQYKIPAYTSSVTTRSVPTLASSGLLITKTDGRELTLGWTSGNGQRRLIIAKQGSDVTSSPADGASYNANAQFGLGQQLAAGEFVVYDGNFNVTTISNLNAATTYYFKIFEYDGSGSTTSYLTTSFASVNGSTAITPTQQSNGLTASNITASSAQLHMAAGNGRGRLIIGRKGSAVNTSPVDFTAYAADSDFGVGQHLGNGNFVLGNSTETNITIRQLDANSTYHFAVFEFNGFNQPLYLAPAAVFSVNTLAALPLKLVSWEVTAKSNAVTLRWTSTDEINVSHFIVERSNDGSGFYPIGTIAATGNAQSVTNYMFEDLSPARAKNWYRLKIVDIDSRYEYSAVRAALLGANAAFRLGSNPVSDRLELISSPSGNNKMSWSIVSAAGQAVMRGSARGSRTEINISALPAGTFYINIVSNNQQQTIPFVHL